MLNKEIVVYTNSSVRYTLLNLLGLIVLSYFLFKFLEVKSAKYLQGVLSHPESISYIIAKGDGRVAKVNTREGLVSSGTDVLMLESGKAVKSPASGRLKVEVKEGDPVAEGQVLITVHPLSYEVRVMVSVTPDEISLFNNKENVYVIFGDGRSYDKGRYNVDDVFIKKIKKDDSISAYADIRIKNSPAIDEEIGRLTESEFNKATVVIAGRKVSILKLIEESI